MLAQPDRDRRRCRSPPPTISISAIPNGPRSWASSSMAIKGIGEACRALDFPIVSGNVSLYNETNGQRHPADADDRRRRPARRLVEDGAHRLCRRGRADPAGRRAASAGAPISASRSICATSTAARDGPPPPVDLAHEKRVGDFVRELIRDGVATAVHDISDGGLAVALAEMAMASGIGADGRPRSPTSIPIPHFFGEDQGRYVVTSISTRQGDEIVGAVGRGQGARHLRAVDRHDRRRGIETRRGACDISRPS